MFWLFPLLTDERRMKIVEMGAVQELLKMLEAAKDDRTRVEALRALNAISESSKHVVLVLTCLIVHS